MSKYEGYTASRRISAVKYQKKAYDQVLLRFRKDDDTLDRIAAHLELTGEERTKFIFRAIEETIQRDRERMRENFKPAPKNEE